MNIMATIKTIFCAENTTPQFYELSYHYTNDTDRLSAEKVALEHLLGGGFGKFAYPPGLGKEHLRVWRRAERCVVAVPHQLGGLQSLRDEEISGVLDDIVHNRPQFVPNPNDVLLDYLTTDADLHCSESDPNFRAKIESQVGLERFRRIREIVRQNGRFYVPQALPSGFSKGELGLCHIESMVLSIQTNLIYVEGFALIGPGKNALLHGWCADNRGRVIDRTWDDRGIAYFGVPFHPEYVRRKYAEFERLGAGQVTGSLFNDSANGWPILCGPVSDWKLE